MRNSEPAPKAEPDPCDKPKSKAQDSTERQSTTIARSQRCEFRLMTAAEAADIYDLNQDPLVLKYTGDQAFDTVAQAKIFLENYDHYRHYGFGRWSIYSRASHEYLGFCGLKYSPQEQQVDLGFRFSRSNWGQGFATETGALALHLAQHEYNLKRVVGRAMQANKASCAVLQKLGMTFQFEFIENDISWIQYQIEWH